MYIKSHFFSFVFSCSVSVPHIMELIQRRSRVTLTPSGTVAHPMAVAELGQSELQCCTWDWIISARRPCSLETLNASLHRLKIPVSITNEINLSNFDKYEYYIFPVSINNVEEMSCAIDIIFKFFCYFAFSSHFQNLICTPYTRL